MNLKVAHYETGKLEKADMIYESNGKYFFMDPAFELWFLKQYFGIDFKEI